MADTILNTAVFSTANMKPATAGTENIDANWGRKISDNTGFLYFEAFQGPTVHSQIRENGLWDGKGTFYFRKKARYGSLCGSYIFYGKTGGIASGTAFATIYANGTIIKGLANKIAGATTEAFVTGSFSYPTSALSDETDYPFTFRMTDDASAGSMTVGQLDLTTWQAI